MTYLIRRRDDVHTDDLFSQDRFGVDAAESSSKFCVLGQGLNNRRFSKCHVERCVCIITYSSMW